VPEKEQRPGAQRTEPSLDFIVGVQGRNVWVVKRDDEEGFFRPVRVCAQAEWTNIRIDTKMLISRMDLRMERVRVYGLESNAEFPDLSQVLSLCSLNQATDSLNISFVEWIAIVAYLKPIVKQSKADAPGHSSRLVSLAPPVQRILSILEQFINEVRSVAIEIGQ